MKRLLCALALAAVTTAPVLASPQSDLEGAMIGLGTAKSYHISVMGKGRSADIDMVKPGKMHLTAGPMEMIKIDNTSYMKLNGTWQKFAIPGVSDQITSMYEGAIKNATSHPDELVVTDVGNTVVDGVPLHGYTVKTKDQATPFTTYLDSKGLPVRMDAADGTVIHFSKINEPIAIDAPM